MDRYPCGKRQQKNDTTSFKAFSVQHLKDTLIERRTRKSRTVKRIAKLSRMELCWALNPRPIQLRYDGANSCFFDTAIVSFFHTYTPWICQHVWNADLERLYGTQEEDYQLAVRVRSLLKRIVLEGDLHVASEIRRCFKEFDQVTEYTGNEVEWLREQNDPADFIQAMYRIFKIPEDVHLTNVTGTNRNVFKGEIASQIVEAFELYQYQHKNKQRPYRLKPLTTSTLKVEKADMLYVNLQRNYNNEEKLTTRVIPPDVILPKRNKNPLRLVSIVLHSGNVHGGHYTCYIKAGRDETWRYYDDMGMGLKPTNTRSLKTLLSLKPDILTKAVGYVYTV